MPRLMLTCLILFIFATAAYAITCYDCDSLHDPRCNEYFDPDGVETSDCDIVDMPAYLGKYGRRIPATGCLTKVHEGVEGRRFFIRRSCYYGNPDESDEACNAEDPYLFFADLISCNVCTEDLCNTSGANKLGFAALVLSIIISGALVLFN